MGRHLGVFSCTLLIVGRIIGTGIFSTANKGLKVHARASHCANGTRRIKTRTRHIRELRERSRVTYIRPLPKKASFIRRRQRGRWKSVTCIRFSRNSNRDSNTKRNSEGQVQRC
ncbi:hypothetical protein C8Q73DRAFT_195546 [Cubamyces lactineus]|nr:hypothetical protein C8Q73DRAFT_195546 [Cubamyces lactineus]